MRLILIHFLVLTSISGVLAQKIKLEHADVLKGGTSGGVRVARPVGNVVFKQGRTTIFCDSAILNKAENSLEAFGKIKILEGDSVTITAGGLTYEGNNRIARLRKNVVFTKLNSLQLFTNYLDYYRNKSLAKYFNGGRLVDTTNVLKSQKGYLNTVTNVAAFKSGVIGENQDFTFTSDTLQYQTKTKVVTFLAPATVVDKDGKVVNYNSGTYNTISKLSVLNDGVIETKSNRMKGDHYKIDDKNFFYRATGNVVITAKEENMIIYGEQGDYYKKQGITKIYGNPYVVRFDQAADTLFLRGDTLVSVEGQDGKTKYLLAYPRVRIFKQDLQAVADSLVYQSADSVMTFFDQPVLWNLSNQMTADTIRMFIQNNSIKKINMISNSFVAGSDDLNNYNQIKGRRMVAWMRNNTIDYVDVTGNGESLYFALEQKSIETDSLRATATLLTGMNKIICSNMKINFMEGKLNNITFYVMPDAKFIPPLEIKEDDRLLKGFRWRETERPTRIMVVGGRTRKPRGTGDKKSP